MRRNTYDKLKEEIHIKHIIVDSERLADSLYNAATGGAEFEQLARDFSLDQSTSMRGGDLGYVRWGMLYEQFQDIAFKLSPGQTYYVELIFTRPVMMYADGERYQGGYAFYEGLKVDRQMAGQITKHSKRWTLAMNIVTYANEGGKPLTNQEVTSK